MNPSLLFIILLLFLNLFSCQPEPISLEDNQQFGSLPESVVAPANNPITEAKMALGKALFWDPILSGNKEIACATCHHPNNGYGDNREVSMGVNGTGLGENRSGGMKVTRNSPTIINSAFNGINADGIYDPSSAPMFWDNRMKSLEEQASGPIHSAEEMLGTDLDKTTIMDTIISRLNNIPAYQQLFEEAFYDSVITADRIFKAIATFERSIIATESNFDRYMRGEESAMNTLQIRGMFSFIEAGCANCHNGPMLSDFELHNIGTTSNPNIGLTDLGGGESTFRTPTLRNLSLTAPYMHNGVFETLDEVMDFYDDLGENQISSDFPLSDDLQGLDIRPGQKEAIIEFLKALDDNGFDQSVPQKVPSGLQPGGNI